MATISPTRQKAIIRKYSRNIKFLMMALSVIVVVLTLPKQAKFMYEIEKGRVWTQNDLISPYNFAILKTQQEIDNDRRTALASVTPIYQLNTDVQQQEAQNFRADLEVKWHNAGINNGKKDSYLIEGASLLNQVYTRG